MFCQIKFLSLYLKDRFNFFIIAYLEYVFLLSIKKCLGDSQEPVKMFDKHTSLANCQIINYRFVFN